MDARLERKARNEGLIREVNEQIEQVDKAAEAASVAPEATFFEFLCECGGDGTRDMGCEQHVRMTVREYETVRSEDDRFAVLPGHENEALECIVVRNERFLIVDKRAQAEPLVKDDPRGSPR